MLITFLHKFLMKNLHVWCGGTRKANSRVISGTTCSVITVCVILVLAYNSYINHHNAACLGRRLTPKNTNFQKKMSKPKFSGKYLNNKQVQNNNIAVDRRNFETLSNDACFTCSNELLCENWVKADKILTRRKYKSLIQTDSTKFLLPWLYNGPNNQLFGLRQAIYVAIYTNRTLVLPALFKHVTDKSADKTIDANYRLNVKSLLQLLPSITIEQYHQHCKNIDVIFPSTSLRNQWTIDELKVAENLLDIELLQDQFRDTKYTSGLPVRIPQVPTNGVTRGFRLDSDKKSIRSVYNSTMPCALYAFPYMELNFPTDDNQKNARVKKSISSLDVENLSPGYLNQLIVEHTQFPSHVQEIASLFIEDAFPSKRFLAIHWRYDFDDFFKFQCHLGNPQQVIGERPYQKETCQKFENLNPSSLPKALHIYISSKLSNMLQSSSNATSVFIAAPPTILDWLTNRFNQESHKYGFRLFTSRDLLKFIEKEKIPHRCPLIKSNLFDTISLLEMQICIQSTVFFSSVRSTWSKNVQVSRENMQDYNPFKKLDITFLKIIAGAQNNK